MKKTKFEDNTRPWASFMSQFDPNKVNVGFKSTSSAFNPPRSHQYDDVRRTAVNFMKYLAKSWKKTFSYLRVIRAGRATLLELLFRFKNKYCFYLLSIDMIFLQKGKLFYCSGMMISGYFCLYELQILATNMIRCLL